MSKVRKLTPALLKKIIKEEKAKINKKKVVAESTKRVNNVEKGIDMVTKLALLEAKELVKIKRLREKRRQLKKLLSKKVR